MRVEGSNNNFGGGGGEGLAAVQFQDGVAHTVKEVAFPEERASLMPAEKAWHLRDIIALLKEYDFTGQRRVSFEYTMFAGLNDTPAHADAIAALLRGLECRVNLIRFHKIPGFEGETSPDKVMEAFRDRLSRSGITATIRASRGEDIYAACGMLAGKNRNSL